MEKVLWFNEEECALFIQEGHARRISYDKNQIIALQGEECKTLGIIQDGAVALQNLDEEGRLFTAQVLTAGHSCGATLLFGSETSYPMQVVAQTQCTILHLNKALVLRLCEQRQDVLVALLAIISDRAHMLGTTINRLSTLSLRESLLSYLHHLTLQQHAMRIRLPITKKELAERLGFARTSVSREFAALQKEGILTIAGREVSIHLPLPLDPGS